MHAFAALCHRKITGGAFPHCQAGATLLYSCGCGGQSSGLPDAKLMSIPTDRHSFPTTHWTVVRQAVGAEDERAQRALGDLCEAYWYPLYAYFRRMGKAPHDAEDLTQGFFARLLARGLLGAADPEKGRLRTFLLTSARNFMVDEYDRSMAQRRQAGALAGFDAGEAEERYAREPADDLAPDRLYQRRWALAVLEYSLEMLREEYSEDGKGELFESLKPFLGFGVEPEKRYEDLSATLGVPVGTLKNKVFRLRQRWRELLFDQVGRTLENPTPEEIKGELAELLGCV